MADFTKKVIIDVKAKGDKEAKRGVEAIDRAVNKTRTDATSLGAAMTKAFNDAGRSAEAQVASLKKFNDAAQSGTGKWGAYKNALKSVGDVMSPLNQGLEILSKGIRFFDAGLDAYAKTSTFAAAESKRLRDELGGVKEGFLGAAGAMAVYTFRSLDLQKALRGGVDRSFGMQAFLGGFEKGKNFGSFFTGDDESADPLAALGRSADAFSKQFRKSLNEATDHWDTRGKAFLESLTAKTKEAKRSFEDFARVGGTDRDQFLNNPYSTALGARAAEQEVKFDDIARTAQFTAGFQFNLAEGLDGETQALERFSSAAQDAYGAIVTGSASVLGAFKGLAQSQLLALGKLELVEAGRQIGLGIGALANPLTAAAAGIHFSSAAKHAAAAALAGAGVAAVGAIPSGGGGSAGTGSSRGSSGGSGGASRTETITNYYVIGDSFSEDSPRIRQRNAERVIDLGMARTSAGRAE